MTELKDAYFNLYEIHGATEEDFQDLLNMIEKKKSERDKTLDDRVPNWFMKEDMIGMMLYVDLFADDFKGIISRIPYLIELGITYVHLMPLLRSREGENDGGYAVEDYLEVDDRLGNKSSFKKMLKAFNDHHIAVCIDYVLNHTSDTHEWAVKARAGKKVYQDMYMMFDDRSIPDAYDKTVPEVLPLKCPGNFTYVEKLDKYVFTSFSEFQWDLNYKNPKVFHHMVENMLELANYGVMILRLDAIAFMWKTLNTSCRNLDEVHEIIHLFHMIKSIAAPGLALLGEAIVEPHEIVKYFDHKGTECGLLYNAAFMVNIFNAFATRDVRLMQYDNAVYDIPSSGCFMNYIRCHDDIGWGFNERYVEKLGFNAFSHKQFLIDFYSGQFEGSFSKGELYQYNDKNKDARINGTLSSLLGLERARESFDSRAIETSLYRIKLAHALIFSHQGIPLIYSGDEIATTNDHQYLNIDDKKEDGRWLHRPRFDWKRAENRYDLTTDEGVIFSYIQKIITIRKNEPSLSGHIQAKLMDCHNHHVYGFIKGELLCLFNFSENNQYVKTSNFQSFDKTSCVDLISDRQVNLSSDEIQLHPYEVLWLK